MKPITTFLAAALISAALPAHADIIAYIDNNIGGRIEFSDVQCSYKADRNWKAAIVIDSSGTPTLAGCWAYADPNVIAEWPGYGTKFYDVREIVLTEAGRK